MGVEIRQFDKVQEKVEIRLDSRQIGWLVAGCVVIASGVFAAGFHTGKESVNAMTTEQAPRVLAAVGEPTSAAVASAVVEPAVDAARAELSYTYDRVLTAPTAPTEVGDPVLEIKAQVLAEQREGEPAPPRAATALAGLEPPEPAEEGETVEDQDPAVEKPLSEEELALELQPAEPKPAAPIARPAKAAAPAGVKIVGAVTPTLAEALSPKFTIQIKAFRRRAEAQQFLSALREAGYHPYMVTADIPGKGRFYRIRLGKFDKLDEAEARQRAFEKAEGFKTILQTLK